MTLDSHSVLVIGGCGFLGHHVVSQLLETSARISVIDLDTTRNRFDSVSYYNADITERASLLSILEQLRPHAIIHTASPVGTSFEGSRELYHKVNVEGTQNLLAGTAHIGGVKALVYTSSASVIHDGVSDLVMADETYPILRPPQQTEYYSYTKGIAERLILEANRKQGNMLTAAVRPVSMFGEGDRQQLPNMLKVYYDGKTNFQLGDNSKWFDFVYVGNVAQAHILALTKLLATHDALTRDGLAEIAHEERVDGEAFIATNDDPYHFWDYARAVWAAAGDTSKPDDAWVIPESVALTVACLCEWIFWLLFWGKKQPNLTRQKIKFSCMNRTFRIDKIKSRLGYKPRWSIREGIKRGVEWFQTQNAKKTQ